MEQTPPGSASDLGRLIHGRRAGPGRSPQLGSARGNPSQENSPQPGSARGNPSQGENRRRRHRLWGTRKNKTGAEGAGRGALAWHNPTLIPGWSGRDQRVPQRSASSTTAMHSCCASRNPVPGPGRGVSTRRPAGEAQAGDAAMGRPSGRGRLAATASQRGTARPPGKRRRSRVKARPYGASGRHTGTSLVPRTARPPSVVSWPRVAGGALAPSRIRNSRASGEAAPM